ncbi:MAG: hypothetical protein JWN52_1673 [Actinomycetia bacterium]|jgi:hypothetical protein|nr:hypothetical protein [Actinomycetes bacterium]
MTVLKKILMTVLLAGVAVLVIQSIPDVRRYLRMRSM